jgi:hypothetical protein
MSKRIDLILTLSFCDVSPEDAVRIKHVIESAAQVCAKLSNASGGVAGAVYDAGKAPDRVMCPHQGTYTSSDGDQDQDQACNVAPVSGVQ